MADKDPGASSSSTPMRAVVFDLFNTLTAPVDDLEFRSSLRDMALAVDADPGAFTEGWLHLWREMFNGTLATTDTGVRGVCEAIGVRVNETAVRRAVQIRAAFSQKVLQPRPDAVSTLTRLRAFGLQTALISNCSPSVPVLWPPTPFARAIDVSLFSCVEGLLKPAPAIYRRACAQLRVDPRACVYVGDGGDHELTGAASVGMRAVLIRTPDERAAAYDSERVSWTGERIDALGELPGLITGEGAAATD